MELIFALAMKFWQWTLVIAFIIIGWLINVLDKRRPNKLKFTCLLYTSPSPRDKRQSRMPSSA